jgi:hypothetical protein
MSGQVETAEEADVVSRMKKIADAYGLWAEVKAAYDSYRAEGEAPAVAADCALYDWDLHV